MKPWFQRKGIASVYRWLNYPYRISVIRRYLPDDRPTLLDVGCGNHSPRITREYLPRCEYHGVADAAWNTDASDERCTDRFFPIDLEVLSQFERIPDRAYDAVICSHVLEHLSDPYEAVRGLLPKLKEGGVFYVEVPSGRSARLPRVAQGRLGIRGCLNFHDDETHKTMVDLSRVAEAMRRQGLIVCRCGTRRQWRRIVLFPLYVLGALLWKGFVPASVFWDVTGFASVLVATKPSRAVAEAATGAVRGGT